MVPLTARKLWARLANMSWSEFETRLHQEISKRLDVTLYRIGLQPGVNGSGQFSSPAGNFFFSADELPSRVSLLRDRLPREAGNIVAEANQICRHRFQLLGYRDVDYGAQIDWHCDAVHGLRSPLMPWYKINFLSFDAVGDHKITWELNRHQHLVTLAKAWLLTNDEVYTQEIVAQWYSWQRANPYPLGINWASSLEVAFRSLSWIWLHRLLLNCPVLPDSFQQDLLRALALHGRHIDRYLSTYFSPNTHLLGEAVALFFIGSLTVQSMSSEAWRTKGWRILQEEILRQVRPDGMYFEQSLYYHVYALDFFLHARLLASRNGHTIPLEFDAVLKKMLSVAQALAQAGPPDGFGDDDGGRVFNPRRNRAEHMTDPLTIGAVLFGEEVVSPNTSLPEEAIWLFGAQALSAIGQPSIGGSAMRSQSFQDGGIYIAGSSDVFAQQMVIDAGPHGVGRGGHGHADALSVKLAFGGRCWLIDSGTFCYIGPGTERNTFRGTRAHNTLTVDGLDQAEPDGPFAWSSIPDTLAELWIPGTTFTFFIGSHSGYERLPQPVRHRRFVFHLHGSFSLVRDATEGQGSHTLETSWHFAQGIEITKCGGSFVATPTTVRSEDLDASNRLVLLPVADPEWDSELLSNFVSPAYGAKLSAALLRCQARLTLPAEHATLLFPAVGKIEDPGQFFRDDRKHGEVDSPEAAYRFEHGSDIHYMVFRKKQKAAWNFGPWTSDARFLYCCVKDRRVDHLVFCDGSFAQFRGESLIAHSAALQWLDWMNREGRHQLLCSDESCARLFSPAALNTEIAI
jgi:hypothetical protein